MLFAVIKFLSYALLPLYLDSKLTPIVEQYLPQSTSPLIQFLPKSYGLVIFTLVLTTFILIKLGVKVGAARKKFDIPLPTMYACENSTNKAHKQFNCIQRGHQQALETYTGFVATTLIGGLQHPLAVSFGGVLWSITRLAWAEGYAKGNPDSRYSHSWLGKHVWTSLAIPLLASMSCALRLLGFF